MFSKLFVPVVAVMLTVCAFTLIGYYQKSIKIVTGQVGEESALLSSKLSSEVENLEDSLKSYTNENGSVFSFFFNLEIYNPDRTPETYNCQSYNVTEQEYYPEIMRNLSGFVKRKTAVSRFWLSDVKSAVAFGCRRLADGSTQNYTADPSYRPSDSLWYDYIILNKTTYLTKPYFINDENGNKVPVMSLAVPMVNEWDEVSAVAALDINLSGISDFAAYTGVCSVSASDGSLIYLDGRNDYFDGHTFKSYEDFFVQKKFNVIASHAPVEYNGADYIIGNKRVSLFGTEWTVTAAKSYDLVNEIFYSTARFVICMFLVAMLVITVVNSAVAWWVVKPIKQITAATSAIAKGDYFVKLHNDRKDELGVLADTVDSALDSLRNRAQFDTLTGLYRKEAFMEIAPAVLHDNHSFVVVQSEIRGFKMVVDLFGRQEADALLKFYAQLLKETLPAGSYAARYDDDRFCMIMPFYGNRGLISGVKSINQRLAGYSLNVTLSAMAGVYIVNDKSLSLEAMCDKAAFALQKWTTEENADNVYFYNETMRRQMLDDQTLEGYLDQALEEGQFYVQLQPKVNCVTEKVVGAEALVRWRHPNRGNIPPSRFVPMFEKRGTVAKLDAYIREQTVKTLKVLNANGIDISVSVNMSRLNIFDDDITEQIVELADRYSVPHGKLELEFTESAFFADVEKMYEVMKSLRKEGFKVAIDDFGSGFSSLNMLKDAPVDIVKLDKEFFGQALMSPKGKTIIEFIVKMIKKLGLAVVAEGIENESQVEILKKLGGVTVQGFYYSKALSTEDFIDFCKK